VTAARATARARGAAATGRPARRREFRAALDGKSRHLAAYITAVALGTGGVLASPENELLELVSARLT